MVELEGTVRPCVNHLRSCAGACVPPGTAGRSPRLAATPARPWPPAGTWEWGGGGGGRANEHTVQCAPVTPRGFAGPSPHSRGEVLLPCCCAVGKRQLCTRRARQMDTLTWCARATAARCATSSAAARCMLRFHTRSGVSLDCSSTTVWFALGRSGQTHSSSCCSTHQDPLALPGTEWQADQPACLRQRRHSGLARPVSHSRHQTRRQQLAAVGKRKDGPAGQPLHEQMVPAARNPCTGAGVTLLHPNFRALEPVLATTLQSLRPSPEQQCDARAVQRVRRQAGQQGGSCHSCRFKRLSLLLRHCGGCRSDRPSANAKPSTRA